MISNKNSEHLLSSTNNSYAIDLTSLLDIFFIVLVFFLLTTYSPLSSLIVSLPETNKSYTQLEQQHTITLSLTEDYWGIDDNQHYHWNSFEAAFQQKIQTNHDLEIIINAEESATVNQLVKIFELLTVNNLSATQILTKQK